MSGIDHVGIACGDLAASVVLSRGAGPVGHDPAGGIERGPDRQPRARRLRHRACNRLAGVRCAGSRHRHLALAAADRASVDAFHRAALAAGGRDHGAPGLRPHYHPHYYSAFVLDPDGNNLEAVCHRAA